MQHRKVLLLSILLFAFFYGISQTGNVGIGIDTPQAKLHISGTTLTDSLRIPTGAREGYIFKSDSLGNGSWSPILGVKVDPTLLDAYQFSNTQPEYIEIQGNYAYVACDNADSLLVFDLSNPSLPVRVGGTNIQFPSLAQGLVVSGDYAYADYGARLFVYDITDPTTPLQTDNFFLSFEDLAFANGYVYVVSSFLNAMVTVNVQNPDSIFTVDTIGLGGDPNGIIIEDNKAYIVDAGTLDLKIFDLSSPEDPVLLSSLNFGSFQTFIEVRDGIVFVTDNGTDTLYIFDATDPANPILASTVGGFLIQNGIVAFNNQVYISDSGKDSLYLFDVHDPYHPKLTGTISVKSTPTRIEVLGDYVYLLNENPDRIEVLRVSQNLVTTDGNGLPQVFDGQLPGLVTIGSNDFMDHLRLNRIGVGGVHLTATDPQGFMVTADNGKNLMYMNAVTGQIGIGTEEPGAVVSSTKMDITGGHVAISNNFGVLSINSDSTGFGAGFDTRPDDGLDLFAGSDNRLRITPGGLVGIGTETPPKLLSLRAPDDFLTGPILQFTGSSTDQVESGRIRFVEGSEPNHRGGFIHYNGNANRLHIGVHNANGTDVADDFNAITIHRNTGKVGIGNLNPVYDVDVFDTSSTSISLRDTNQHILMNVGPSGASLRTVTEDPLSFWTNNTRHVTLNHIGNFGIGEAGPSAPLHVKSDQGENTGLGGLVKFENGFDQMLFDGNEIDATASTLFLQNNTTNDLHLVDGGGNVGVGIAPTEKLTVAGTIHSTTGGIKFPDGSIQASASSNLGWNLGGNIGTSSANFLGTTDGQPLQLRTNNANRIHVDASGKIGLNTTATRTMLTLRGPNDPDNGPIVYMYGDGSDQVESGRIRFVESTSSLSWRGGYIHYDGSGNRLHIGTHDTGDKLITNDFNSITLHRNTGNVGIHTSNPEHPLHINKAGTAGSSTIDLVLASATSKRPTILFSENASSLDLADGMSIEYNGSVSGNELTINKVGGAPALTIESSSGEVGIGTTNPTALLEVIATTVKKTNGGSWTASSDVRLKTNIRHYTEGLDKVLGIQPVHFKYNGLSGYDTSKEHIGVIAQELENVAPHMVSTYEKDGEEYLQVDNSAMTYMLINAVKEQQSQIKILEQRLSETERLKKEIEILKNLIVQQNHPVQSTDFRSKK
jgi:hypothetical protein